MLYTVYDHHEVNNLVCNVAEYTTHKSQKSLGGTAVIQPMGQGGSRSPCSYILASLNWFPSPNRSKIAPVFVCPRHANLLRFLRATGDVKQFSEAKM